MKRNKRRIGSLRKGFPSSSDKEAEGKKVLGQKEQRRGPQMLQRSHRRQNKWKALEMPRMLENVMEYYFI